MAAKEPTPSSRLASRVGLPAEASADGKSVPEERATTRFFWVLVIFLGICAGIFVVDVPTEGERRLRTEFNAYRIDSQRERRDLTEMVLANQKAALQTQEALRNTEKVLKETLQELAVARSAEGIRRLQSELEALRAEANRERLNLTQLLDENRQALLRTQEVLKATEEELRRTQKALADARR